MDLHSAFDFTGDTVRHFKLQKESSVIDVSDDGKVLLKTLLDREELCGQGETCKFVSTVAVLPQDVYEKIVLELLVEDVNDNAPRFKEAIISINVPESAKPNVRIEVPDLRAADEDIGINGHIEYQVLPSGHFVVEDDDFRTYLIPQQSLDREKASHWQGTVIARDGGGREAHTQLQVNIQDENDNAPSFTGSRFLATVEEGQPPGTFIYQVEATDMDNEDNGLVQYQIVKVEPRSASDLFTIDAATGYIKTTEAIDREVFDSVAISVEASDNGTPPLKSDCVVTVTVKDKNDHPPIIELTAVYESENDSGLFAVVDENSEIGTFVAFATFVDEDFGDNSRLTVTVAPASLFEIKKDPEGDYVVRTTISFDREETEFYNMTVTACDNGKPKLCSELTQRVQIGDQNDNKPIMTEQFRTVSLDENVPMGTVVTQVEATDADKSTKYGKLTYALSGSDDFAIDADTGVISVSKEVDYENQRDYNLTITATDDGDESDTAVVEILVKNLNDNMPTIDVSEIIYLESDVSVGDIIFSFEVDDADGSMPSVDVQGEDAEKFTISGNNILLATNFTRDFLANIVLVVSDGDDSDMKVEQKVKIQVAINFAAVGGGIACGVLSIILIVSILMLKFCHSHRYKLTEQFNSLRRGGPINQGQMKKKMTVSDDAYSRSDMIISDEQGKLVKTRSTRSTSDGSLEGLQSHGTQKTLGQKRNDSDSGRGESESDTHSRNHHNSILMGDWCQPECLTLGHSDSCWLPQMPKNHYEVEVTKNSQQCQASSLSVWDRTSDYSSHTAGSTSGNDYSSKMSKSSNAKISLKTPNDITVPLLDRKSVV